MRLWISVKKLGGWIGCLCEHAGTDELAYLRTCSQARLQEIVEAGDMMGIDLTTDVPEFIYDARRRQSQRNCLASQFLDDQQERAQDLECTHQLAVYASENVLIELDPDWWKKFKESEGLS